MRLQLALNVTDLDEAIDFYSKMFGAEPAKTKPGYANFAIENPPLKLVLFEVGGDHPEAAAPGEFHHLNHLGVETETADEVVAADARITGAGITTTGVEDAVCCYAEKTETWVQSPEGARWEWYVKSGDTDQMEHAAVGTSGVCCG
jgi:catechol 2,3-dioxygenase-like lactoylglutathione lyase family enzyme